MSKVGRGGRRVSVILATRIVERKAGKARPEAGKGTHGQGTAKKLGSSQVRLEGGSLKKVEIAPSLAVTVVLREEGASRSTPTQVNSEH